MCVRIEMYVCERRMYVCENARMNYGLYGPSYVYICMYIYIYIK